MQVYSEDFELQNYDYELPAQQIAQNPRDKRGESSLLVYNRQTEEINWTCFKNILDFLPAEALIVSNNSKVIPARLLGKRKDTGGKAEFLLLTPLPFVQDVNAHKGWRSAHVEGVLRIKSRIRTGLEVEFTDYCKLVILHQKDFGRVKAELFWKEDLKDILYKIGHMPLPPYIQRPDSQMDKKRYQTVYAKEEKCGSVAAPTAGLHFSPDLMQKMQAKWFKWAEVTLYVGYGTFSPIRCQDIRKHQMHPEFIEISKETAAAVKQAKTEDRPVVAVGTTTVRTLESVASMKGEIIPFAGWTDHFIYPGYSFQVVDHLITNFHLPQSSLILMVSALVGRKKLLSLYEQALEKGYRFFSYGDAMLVL